MRILSAAILILGATSVAAAAGDLDGHHHARAFWLDAQPWPNPQPGAASDAQPTDPRFAMTYTDALAARLGVGDGRAQFFSANLDRDDPQGPKLMGTIDSGAAPAFAALVAVQ